MTVLVQRLDCRVRLLVAFCLTLTLALSRSFEVLTIGLGVGLFLVAMANIPNRTLARRLAPVGGLIFVLWLTLPFTTGLGAVGLFPLKARGEGIALAATLTLRILGVILILQALLSTLEATELGYALQWLRCPGRLVQLLFFLTRYFEIVRLEFERMRLAAKARGFRPGTNRHTYWTFGNLIGMLLVRSAERAERVREAMICRGFHGRFHPVSQNKFKLDDWLFLIVGVCFSLWLCWMERV